MNKKGRVFIVIGVLVLVIMVGVVFLWLHVNKIRETELKNVMEISAHYGEFVVTKKKTTFYQKKENEFIPVGEIEAGVSIPLKEQRIETSKDVYFEVLGEDYAVYYKDVEKIESIETEKNPLYYLNFKDTFHVKENTLFYKNKEAAFSIPKENVFSILYGDEEYYFVSYLNAIYEVKKRDGEIVSSYDELVETNLISVYNIPKVNDACSQSSCIKTNRFKEFLASLQKEGFYSITLEEYNLWKKGNVRLLKGATLFVSPSENQELFQEYNYQASSLKCIENNTTNQKDNNEENINCYGLNQNTTNEQFEKMKNGENVVLPKPPVYTSGLPSMNANATRISVLNYHFFYDSESGESCNEGNCLDVRVFRSQLDYLKENNYKTLTMDEYVKWIRHEIELPARSVLLTVDDGAMGTGKHNGNKLIPLLEEYKMNATLFLISGWWDRSNYVSPYLELESHTFDMHKERICDNQTRGAQLLCASKEMALADLKKSIQVVGSSKAFCFPFYAYNTSTIELVTQAGFQVAFLGGSRKSLRSDNHYKLPRYPIHKNITLQQFKNMIH